jgi:hypothetical protein
MLAFALAGGAARADQNSGTATLLLRVDPACAVQAGSNTLEATQRHGSFEFLYRLRTSKTGGGGIELLGAESIGSIGYQTELDGVGTAIGGATSGAPLSVATFGQNQRTSRDWVRGRVRWALADEAVSLTAPPAFVPRIRCD